MTDVWGQPTKGSVWLGMLNPQPWAADALCAQVDNGDAFYPPHGDVAQGRIAKRICGMCPVKADCLDWAVENREPFGIWGGLGPRSRRQLEERKRAA